MNLKCENGHELSAENQKFCGECGAAATGGEGACDCGTAFAKGARFCLNCGTERGPLGGGAGDLEARLDEVESYIKARAGLVDEMALPTLDPDDTSSSEDVERILKAAAVVDRDTGDEIGVDAVPVVTAFMKGMGDLATANQMYAEHITDVLRTTFDGQTTLMKAVLALGRKVEAIANAPSGPRSLGPAQGLGGEFTKAGANGNGHARGGEFDALTGPDLLLKATVAAERNPDLLSTQEIAIVEHFGNNEGSLADMRATHPEVAARVEHALRETRSH